MVQFGGIRSWWFRYAFDLNKNTPFQCTATNLALESDTISALLQDGSELWSICSQLTTITTILEQLSKYALAIDAHIADLAQHRLIWLWTSTIELFSASKVLALIAVVNGVIAEHLIFKAIAMMLNQHTWFRCSSCWAIQQGWTYEATVAGTFTEDVEAGDFNISNKMRLLLSHGTVKLTKTSQLFFPATTTVAGIITQLLKQK
jgi:hypothetical protein